MTDKEAIEKSIVLNGREVEAIKFIINKWHKICEIMDIPDEHMLVYNTQLNKISKKIRESNE
jgi:hypothetical protein